MHGTVTRQSFQTFRHIDQILYLFVRLISPAQFRILFQRFVDSDVQLLRDHFRNCIYESIGQIHHPSHVADNAPGRKGSKGHDLHHTVFPVFSHHIINDLLPSLKAEVNVDIGHGHTFRIQETLKEKLIPDRIDRCDSQTVGNDTSRRGSSSRSHRDPVILGIFDKIPYNKEIIHIPHIFNGIQLIGKAVFEFL